MEHKKSYDNYDKYLRDCDPAQLANIGASPVTAQYKNMELCNTANISEDEFKIRNQYFRNKTDELWRDYYWDYVEKFVKGAFKGFFSLLGLMALVILIRWVLQGSKKA